MGETAPVLGPCLAAGALCQLLVSSPVRKSQGTFKSEAKEVLLQTPAHHGRGSGHRTLSGERGMSQGLCSGCGELDGDVPPAWREEGKNTLGQGKGLLRVSRIFKLNSLKFLQLHHIQVSYVAPNKAATFLDKVVRHHMVQPTLLFPGSLGLWGPPSGSGVHGQMS